MGTSSRLCSDLLSLFVEDSSLSSGLHDSNFAFLKGITSLGTWVLMCFLSLTEVSSLQGSELSFLAGDSTLGSFAYSVVVSVSSLAFLDFAECCFRNRASAGRGRGAGRFGIFASEGGSVLVSGFNNGIDAVEAKGLVSFETSVLVLFLTETDSLLLLAFTFEGTLVFA